MPEETRLAAFLREQARSREMSQNEFARHVGVSGATISAIRHGQTPSIAVIRQIAEALDIRANDLAELAGIIDPDGADAREVPPEVRTVLRRYAKLPPDRQQALLRMLDEMITFAEPPVR